MHNGSQHKFLKYLMTSLHILGLYALTVYTSLLPSLVLTFTFPIILKTPYPGSTPFKGGSANYGR